MIKNSLIALLSCFSLFACTSTLPAQTQGQAAQSIQERHNAQIAPKTLDPLYGFSVIDYEEFKQNNDIERQREKDFAALREQAPLGTVWYIQDEILDYVAKTKNVHYVYIGEAHDIPYIQQEVERIIRAVREANPDKKILLASEFFKRTHPLINPLHKEGTVNLLSSNYKNFSKLADELHMDTLALDDEIIIYENGVPLIKMGDKLIRLGQEQTNVFMTYFKDKIEKDASEILSDPKTSLDKARQLYFDKQPPQFFEDAYASVQSDDKLRDFLASYAPDTAKFMAAVITGGLDTEFSPEERDKWAKEFVFNDLSHSKYILPLFAINAWGIKQRNFQWAQRIKEVEKQYDTVIIWGGKGHITTLEPTYASYALPHLLSSSDAIVFSFSQFDEDEWMPGEYKERRKATAELGFEEPSLDEPREPLVIPGIDTKRSFFREINRREVSVPQELQEKILETVPELGKWPELPPTYINVTVVGNTRLPTK